MEAPPPVEVEVSRALGFSVSAVLGDPAKGDPNVVFQTSFASDAPEALIRDGVDLIMRQVERLSAKAEIGRIEEHNRQLRRMLGLDALNEKRRKEAAAREIAQIGKEIAALKAKVGQVEDLEAKAWTENGRVGKVKITAAGRSQIEGAKREVAQLEQTRAGYDLKEEEAREAAADSQAKWQAEIEEGLAAIRRLSAVIE